MVDVDLALSTSTVVTRKIEFVPAVREVNAKLVAPDYQSINQSIKRSFNQSLSQSMQSVNVPSNEMSKRKRKKNANKAMDIAQLFAQSTNQSTNQSINQSANQSTSQSVDQSSDHVDDSVSSLSNGHLDALPIDQSINQSTSQSLKPNGVPTPSKKLQAQLAKPSIRQSVNQSINPSVIDTPMNDDSENPQQANGHVEPSTDQSMKKSSASPKLAPQSNGTINQSIKSPKLTPAKRIRPQLVVDQSVDQSIDQSDEQPKPLPTANDLFAKKPKLQALHSAEQPSKQSINQPQKQSVSQSQKQTVDQPKNQSANQSKRQAHSQSAKPVKTIKEPVKSTSQSLKPSKVAKDSDDNRLQAAKFQLFNPSSLIGLNSWTSIKQSADQSINQTIHRKVGVGLNNLGNSCFMNATLQAMMHTPAFYAYAVSKQHSKRCTTKKVNQLLQKSANQSTNQSNQPIAKFCLFCAMEMHANAVFNAEKSSISPTRIFSSLRSIGRQLRPGRQEDAHEFLRLALDMLHQNSVSADIIAVRPPQSLNNQFHQRFNPPPPSKPQLAQHSIIPASLFASLAPGDIHRVKETSVIYAIYGGYLRSSLHCRNCDYQSNTFEPFLDLSLSIPSGGSSVMQGNQIMHKFGQFHPKHQQHKPAAPQPAITLSTLLSSFCASEQLDAANMWKCKGCNSKTRALKRLSIHRAPHVLVVHLKRFEFLSHGGGKIGRHVKFDTKLDFTQYMSGSVDQTIYQTSGQSVEPIAYTLCGVLVHSGSTVHSGHYFSFVAGVDGKWYEMNDSSVTPTPIETVLQQKAYMLFYTKQQDHESVRQTIKAMKKQVANDKTQSKSINQSIDQSTDQSDSDDSEDDNQVTAQPPIESKLALTITPKQAQTGSQKNNQSTPVKSNGVSPSATQTPEQASKPADQSVNQSINQSVSQSKSKHAMSDSDSDDEPPVKPNFVLGSRMKTPMKRSINSMNGDVEASVSKKMKINQSTNQSINQSVNPVVVSHDLLSSIKSISYDKQPVPVITATKSKPVVSDSTLGTPLINRSIILSTPQSNNQSIDESESDEDMAPSVPDLLKSMPSPARPLVVNSARKIASFNPRDMKRACQSQYGASVESWAEDTFMTDEQKAQKAKLRAIDGERNLPHSKDEWDAALDRGHERKVRGERDVFASAAIKNGENQFQKNLEERSMGGGGHHNHNNNQRGSSRGGRGGSRGGSFRGSSRGGSRGGRGGSRGGRHSEGGRGGGLRGGRGSSRGGDRRQSR